MRIGQAAELFEKFGAEMVVAAFTLDRFDDQAGDIALVLAGSDPYEKDALPSTAPIKMSLEQLFERDKLVYRFLEDRQIPGAYLMAGGYGESAWEIYSQFLIWALLDRLDGDGHPPD